MKRCPACGRTFTNATLINCLNDGTLLVEDTPTPPPYFGVPPAAAETPSFAETPPPAAAPDTPVTVTPTTVSYTNTSLSAIPELQSPEMQAALKEALDKAGMSSLFGTDLSAKSTVTVTTSTTTSQSDTPFAYSQTPPPGFAQTPPPGFTGASPYYAGAAAPRQKRSPWVGLIIFALALIIINSGFQYLRHIAKPDVPVDVVAAVKSADAAEVKAVSSLDPTPLYSAYTGPALSRELSEVDALKTARRTQEDQLTSQEFSGFKQSADGSEAQVEVTEKWKTTIYSEPGHTVVSQNTSVNPQTVFLKRTHNGWIVENIEFHHS